MYRPTYYEPHNDLDWDAIDATTVDGEPEVETRPLDDVITGSLPITAGDQQLLQTLATYDRAIAEAVGIPTIEIPPPLPAVTTLPIELTVTTDGIVYDAMQEKAITDCGEHLFTHISGTAGVGKTFVAKEIMRRHPGVVLAATTGIASVNLGEGTTINALLHYFNTAQLGTKYMEGQIRRQIDWLRRCGVRRILIDEKSMMAGDQLTYITRAVRESNEGGVYALEEVGTGEEVEPGNKREEPPPMGITLVGDFGQLPPVPDEEEYKDPKTGQRRWKKLPVKFAFDSPEWPLYAAHTTCLTTIYRQADREFIAALHAVRAGDVVTALRFFTPDRFSPLQDDHFDGSTIVPKNDMVDRYNQLRIDALPGEKMIARSIRQGDQRPDWKNIPETLVLKEGALVMLLANRRVYDDADRPTLIYANGDLATLIGKDEDGAWQARLQRNNKVVTIYPVERENTIPLVSGRRKQIKQMVKQELQLEGWQTDHMDEEDFEAETSYTRAGKKDRPRELWDGLMTDDPEVLKAKQKEEFQRRLAQFITDEGKGKFEIIGRITYMPARAAYACTVHKTQGLTLDKVQVNIRDSFMGQPGMLFVALSRARTAEGLRIVGDQSTFIERCRTEPRVQPWL